MWINNLSELGSSLGTVHGDAFAAVVLISIVAVIANYFGTWIYLFTCDGSRRSDKVWWAIWFFFVGPIATIPYFVLVYRRQYLASMDASSSLGIPQIE